jgi:hypothetical protein
MDGVSLMESGRKGRCVLDIGFALYGNQVVSKANAVTDFSVKDFPTPKSRKSLVANRVFLGPLLPVLYLF